MEEISFKSNRENFIKELHGIKCNTLRRINPDDERYFKVSEMIKTKNYGIIEITCGDSCFKRKIKDVTYWDGYLIISWDNPDVIKRVLEIIDNIKEIEVCQIQSLISANGFKEELKYRISNKQEK